MRLEATVPDSRGAAVQALAKELGLKSSQLVDEALALFLKAVLEVRRGRRLMMVDSTPGQPACELATPTLSALEWALKPARVELPEGALDKMAELTKVPPAPSARLRKAAKRHRP